MIEAADGDTESPELRREALAFHREEYQGKVLHNEARQRTKSRVLLLLVPVLLGLVAGFAALVKRSAGQGPNETLLVATAGALGAR